MDYDKRIKGKTDHINRVTDGMEVIYYAVRNHAYPSLPINLQEKLDENLFDGRTLEETIETDKGKINSLYSQSIIDVDKFDLFNQVLIGNIPIIRKDFGLDFFEGDKVEDLSKVWGIPSEKLREYNNIPKNEQMKPNSIIRIPTNLVPIENFILPNDIIEMFKNNTLPSLKELQARKDYSFLCAQVFRLSLLRNINFISMLKSIKEQDILGKTLNLYTDEYKEIMKPIFKYTDEYLVEHKIENGNSKIYTK